MVLLKKGDLEKAQLEFRNALQIKKNMTLAMYGLALIAERKGDWKQMYGLLRNVVEQDPKHLEAQVKLGKLLLAAGQLDKALDASNKALALNKDDLSVITLHAAVLLKMGDAKGAIENANLALSKDPNYVDALVVLTTERLAAKDSAKAIEYLDQGLKQNEKNLALQLIKIQALESLSSLDKAEEVFHKLIQFYPDATALRRSLAQFYLKHGRQDEAEAELRAIVTHKPDDFQAKLEVVSFLNTVKGNKVARQELETYSQKEPNNLSLKFALVEFYRASNDLKATESVLREIMTKAGNNPDGLKAKGLLAAMLVTSGDKKSGAKMLEEILAQDKRNEQALILRAGMEIDANKLDAAISDLRSVLRDVPDSSRALVLLAQAHDRAGSPELADESFLRAFRASKMAAPYGLTYAQFLMKRKQVPRAEKILEELLASTPGHMPALKMLAQARISQGDWVGAQEVADEIRRRGDKDKVSDQIMGVIFAGKKNYAESIGAFKRAYEAAPNQTQPVMALIRTYLLAGKAKEAQSFLGSVLQANPDNIDARVMQGQLHAMNGEKQQAVESFSSVISRAPKNAVGYYQLAVFYLRDNRREDAEKVVGQGLAAVPGDLGLSLTQAGIYEMTGRNEEAIRLYESLIKERPDAEILANNLASLLAENRSDKTSLNRAYDLAQRFKHSEVPQFKDTLGWASYKAGKPNEAVPILEDAIKQLPEEPIFHYHLGMSYLAKPDKASKISARKELEKALQLAGNKPFAPAEEIRKILKEL